MLGSVVEYVLLCKVTNWSLYLLANHVVFLYGCSISIGCLTYFCAFRVISLLLVHKIGDCDPPWSNPCKTFSYVEVYLYVDRPCPVDMVYSICLKTF